MSTQSSLAIVGTGMMMGGDLTLAAKAWIEKSDVVLFHVVDPYTAKWILSMNPKAEPLALPHSERRAAGYKQMAEKILERVEPGKSVCALFYGHPLVLTDPAAATWRLARSAGIPVKIFPGVSSVAAMMADLGVDLYKNGCQIMEATDMLVHGRRPDDSMHVVILQPAMVGNLANFDPHHATRGLTVLRRYLAQTYPGNHEIFLYGAAFNAAQKPSFQKVHLDEVARLQPAEYMSLYIPPARRAAVDAKMVRTLGLQHIFQTHKADDTPKEAGP